MIKYFMTSKDRLAKPKKNLQISTIKREGIQLSEIM